MNIIKIYDLNMNEITNKFIEDSETINEFKIVKNIWFLNITDYHHGNLFELFVNLELFTMKEINSGFFDYESSDIKLNKNILCKFIDKGYEFYDNINFENINFENFDFDKKIINYHINEVYISLTFKIKNINSLIIYNIKTLKELNKEIVDKLEIIVKFIESNNYFSIDIINHLNVRYSKFYKINTLEELDFMQSEDLTSISNFTETKKFLIFNINSKKLIYNKYNLKKLDNHNLKKEDKITNIWEYKTYKILEINSNVYKIYNNFFYEINKKDNIVGFTDKKYNLELKIKNNNEIFNELYFKGRNISCFYKFKY